MLITQQQAEDCITRLSTLINNVSSSSESLTWFDDNPIARNLVMGADPHICPAFTTEDVLYAHIGPHTEHGLVPDRLADGSLLFTALCDTTAPDFATAKAQWFATNVLSVIWKNYPNLSKDYGPGGRYATAFAKGILGTDVCPDSVNIQFNEIHRRMTLADEAFLKDPLGGRPCSTHAEAWVQDVVQSLDKRQILIDACNAWLPELQKIASTNYLDVLAGVSTGGPVSSSPSSGGHSRLDDIDHLDVKDEQDGRSLGAVFQWSNCFSDAFHKRAMETHIPNLPFMRDGMKKGKNRLSRVSYEVPGVPFCLRKEQPFLMLSDTALAFEADMLKCGNYLNKLLHQFTTKFVVDKYGPEVVDDIVPNLEDFDMIHSSLNSLLDGGYSGHDDSGYLVSDNNLNYGDEDHNLMVPTFVWSNRADAETDVTWTQKGGSKKNTLKTTTCCLHFQTRGLQHNCDHKVSAPKRGKTVIPLSRFDHRLAQSLRSTARFQEAHHKLLRSTNPNILSVGDPDDYNFHQRLGATCELNQLMGTPIRPNEASAGMNATPRPYFTQAELSIAMDAKDLADSNALDSTVDGDASIEPEPPSECFHVVTPRYKAPTDVYANFPSAHERWLKSRLCPHAFFRSGPGLRRLVRHRITPVVHYPDADSPGFFQEPVHYGLSMEQASPAGGSHHPVRPGAVLSATAVYSSLGLTSSMTDSQVWTTDHEKMTGIVLTKNYKNQFPDAENSRGPLLDYRRLKSNIVDSREGFYICGAGGASELIGQVTPDISKPSSLEAAVLEHPQKVNSAKNMAMMQAAHRQAWVHIYVKVGAIVPVAEVDYTSHSKSKSLHGHPMDQVIDLGCYEISSFEYCNDSLSQLQRQVIFQDELPVTSPLKVHSIDAEFKRYLRFRTQGHFKFHLSPIHITAAEAAGDWRYLQVSSVDPRRMQIPIPKELGLVAALGVDASKAISVEQVYDDWVDRDKLYVNFLSLRTCTGMPFSSHELPPPCELDLMDASDQDLDDEDDLLEIQELLHDDHLLDDHLLDGEQLTELPEEKKRSLSCDQACVLLLCISLGVFARVLKLNVDDDDNIRPLVDPWYDHDYCLLNYHKHITDGGKEYDHEDKVPMHDLLPLLGETNQRNVFPHTSRTYDVPTLYLIACTGGGALRESRQGIKWVAFNKRTVADFLVHSIVLRTLGKTHALKRWCQYSRHKNGRIGSSWFLPGVEDTTEFLEFVSQCVAQPGNKQAGRKNELHDFTSSQFFHTLDDQFKSLAGLTRVLDTWHLKAMDVIEGFLKFEAGIVNPQMHSAKRDTFIKSLIEVFVQAGCREKGQRLRFVCSQVVQDMDELIDELPFGPHGRVCRGPGSTAGHAVFGDEAQTEMSLKYTEMTVDNLLMQGLERADDGCIRVILNKRRINEGDREHQECKIGIIVHRLPGGGRSISEIPRKQVAHCHPQKTMLFEDGISMAETAAVLEIAKNAIDAFRRSVISGTWETPDGILGEKVWRRPT